MASIDAIIALADKLPRLPYGIVCNPAQYTQIAGLVPPGILVEWHPKHPIDEATICDTCEAFGRVLREYEYGHIQP